MAEERLSNMRTVRAFVGENREIDIYDTRVNKVYQLSYKEAVARGIFWAMVNSVYMHLIFFLMTCHGSVMICF